MAIKAGQILHDANGFVIDRIQTGGVGNLNLPEEKIYELGNYQTVATIRDIPDLSFDLESLDVTTEIEAVVNGEDPAAVVAGDAFDFINAKPLDVISPFKSASGAFDIVRGVAVPYLTLENVTYRFGTRANATQAYTFRGDSVFYIPGTPYLQQYPVAGTTYAFDNTALGYARAGATRYALSVCVKNNTTNKYKRLFHGVDYTDTPAGITTTTSLAGYDTIHVTYGSATAATYPQSVHQNVSVKPAAVRGKDIDVYVYNPLAATPALARWSGVQSVEVSRRVNLDRDEEFGNEFYVAQDYDTAEVSGSITVRSRDVEDLFRKIHQVTNVPETEIAGALTSTALALEIRINNPDTGVRVKTLYVQDARIQPPGIQGRVQQKLETTFNFTSDGGNLIVYAGARP